MSAQPSLWPYPAVGQIAITHSGARIAVWHDESDHPECFTGQLLEPGANEARAVVHNLSTLWRRDAIVRVEPPTAADLQHSLVELVAA